MSVVSRAKQKTSEENVMIVQYVAQYDNHDHKIADLCQLSLSSLYLHV